MAAVSLPVELGGCRFDSIHLGDALLRHADHVGISPTHVQAGRRLATGRFVLIEALDHLRDGLALHASVTDGGETFRVAVELAPHKNALQVESANCSCTRSAPCRHSMAVSIDVASRGGTAASRPEFKSWLDSVLKLLVPGKSTPIPRETAPDQVWPTSLIRSLVPIGVLQLNSSIRPLVAESDIALLLPARRIVGIDDPSPFSLDADRDLELTWVLDGASAQRLAWDVKDNETLLGCGRDIYLLNRVTRTLSPVRYPRALAEWMAHAPALEPSSFSSAAYRIREAGQPIPVPRSLAQIETVRLAPRVAGRFANAEVFSRRTREPDRTQSIELSFSYDLHVHRPGAMGELDGRKVRFARDTRIEDRVIRDLVDDGLEIKSDERNEKAGGGVVLISGHARSNPRVDLMLAHLDALVAAGVDFALPPNAHYLRLRDLEIDLEEMPEKDLRLRLMASGVETRFDVTHAVIDLVRRADFPWEPEAGETNDSRRTLKVEGRTYVSLPIRRIRQIGLPLMEVTQGRHQCAGDGVLIRQMQAVEFEALLGSTTTAGAARLREVIGSVGSARSPVVIPKALRAELRPYQVDGLSWLTFLAAANAGGVLADDMGLGKTMQILAHILSEREQGRLQAPVLVVAPLTVIGVWLDQCAQFAPTLQVRKVHGQNRHRHYATIDMLDVVLVTYGTVSADAEELSKIGWGLLVGDEAQALKNPETHASQSFTRIKRARTILTSGTPIENRLLDLWSLMNHAQVGFLGSRQHFGRLYRLPIERNGDPERQLALRRKIRPLILRRLKADVAAELPPKTYQVLPVPLEGAQRDHYESIRQGVQGRVMDHVRQKGLEKSGIVVLDALLRLRQACCSPQLGSRRLPADVPSAKQALLLDLLDSLLQAGRKVLVFSQFAEMINLISCDLDRVGIKHSVVTGQVGDRDAQICAFKTTNTSVMLLTLKVGSAGLNLQDADTVILYDPWWNGSIEAQAEDRAHRIGQTRQVNIYRLVCPGTVEERVLAIAQRKLKLASALLDPDESVEGGSWLTMKELEELFDPIQE